MDTPNGQTTFHAKENLMNSQDDFRRRYLMNRRAFAGMATAGGASPLLARAATAQPAPMLEAVTTDLVSPAA
jgi:hypothetical protein